MQTCLLPSSIPSDLGAAPTRRFSSALRASCAALFSTLALSGFALAERFDDGPAYAQARCSELVGAEVQASPVEGAEGETLGVIHDLLVQPETGEVLRVIVRTGGLGRLGDTLRCFDAKALGAVRTRQDLGGELRFWLAVTPNAFRSARSISERDLDGYRAEIIATQGHGQRRAPKTFQPAAPIILASDLMRLKALCGGESGVVKDVWLDLSKRQMTHLDVRIDGQVVSAPLQSLTLVAEPRTRALTARFAETRRQLALHRSPAGQPHPSSSAPKPRS
ncbi:MAG: PRC-barrel domain-containing protein [Planctomycetota bacterium]